HCRLSPVVSLHPSPSRALQPLSLHDALPIFPTLSDHSCLIPFLFQKEAKHDRQLSHLYAIIQKKRKGGAAHENGTAHRHSVHPRSEEHTSELQSRFDLVCRLLLEKKKNDQQT